MIRIYLSSLSLSEKIYESSPEKYDTILELLWLSST